MKQLLSFVIPCYRSAASIGRVVNEICETVETDGRYEYEIILVNDNPPDETFAVIRQIALNNAHVKGLCMARNFSQHNALMAGLRNSSGDIVVTLDDDGQNPPHEMFKLIDALDETTDVAYGIYAKKQHEAWRNWGSKFNDLTACWMIGKPKGLYLCSYNASKRQVIDEVIRYTGPYPYVYGLQVRSTALLKNVEIEHLPREEGGTTYSLAKLISCWLNCFTLFSVKPLRLSAFFGAGVACIGFVLAIAVVLQKLILGDVGNEGWTSLMCVLLVIGGLILAMMGLLGEYLGRLFLTDSGTPQYIIRNVVQSEQKAEKSE